MVLNIIEVESLILFHTGGVGCTASNRSDQSARAH